MQGENTREDHRGWKERGKERRERYFWSSGGKERAIPERGHLPFSLSLSLSLGGREAARTEGNELSRQSSFSRSHFVLTLLSPPSACVCIAIRQPIPPPLVLSLVFPLRLSEKLDFLFPPYAENALALIAERKKRRVEEGERGGEWRGISTKRINHGESGQKGGREREARPF